MSYTGEKPEHHQVPTFPGWHHGARLRFVMTGEFRPPRLGEMFLSGAIPEGYECLSGRMTQSYHILRIAKKGHCPTCGGERYE